MKQIQFLTAALTHAAKQIAGMKCETNPSGVVRRYTRDTPTILRVSFGRVSTIAGELFESCSRLVRGTFEEPSRNLRETFDNARGIIGKTSNSVIWRSGGVTNGFIGMGKHRQPHHPSSDFSIKKYVQRASAYKICSPTNFSF